jgi:glucose uptake protein
MFVPTTFEVALVMMILSTVCWGSWANGYKVTKNYRFEFFYWDFAFGIVIISLVLAFTMGSSAAAGDSQRFLANVHSADTSNIASAFVGGFIFNIANLLLVAGIEMAGLAVAFPISIGVALVVGVALSYSLQPKGSALMLAVGVALAVIAVIMDGKAYGALPSGGRVLRGGSRKSVIVCLTSGVLMGSFAPFVTRALTSGHALGPYSIAVFFTLGSLLCCFFVNVYFMKKPLIGDPVNFSGYFAGRPWYHVLGLIGGLIWGTGTVFNFVAAKFTGVAISYAIGQASPMVAALWGVFVFKEFKGAGASAKNYLVLMFAFYILALIVVARAYQAG